MAMTKCRECGQELSTKAETCPHCGAKRKKGSPILRLIILGLFLLIVVAWCSGPHPSYSPGTVSAPTSLPPPSCGPNDFTITKLNAYVEYDYAKLTGIVRHSCSFAVGVQLKWTAYNSDGTVAFSQDFWPASTTNIPPNTDYPFEMMNTAPRGKWRYTVEAIGVDQW